MKELDPYYDSYALAAARRFEYILEFFPDYDYHKLKEGLDTARLDYGRVDNLVGHQQRAFIVYWALKGASQGGIGVDMGCGEIIHPFCLGIDKYAGDSHPDYPSPTKANYHPHMVWRADKPLPFTDGCFDFLVSHHSLEHMQDVEWTLREWIRIVKKDGILAIVMPDAKFGGADDDKSHKASFTSEQFKAEILDPLVEEKLIEIVEWNTFNNNFSMNVVLKKREKK